MTMSGIGEAVKFYNIVKRNSVSGVSSFDDAVADAEEKFDTKSAEELLQDTLYEIYRNKQQESSEKEEKKDFWETRTERQKLLDEQFEKARLQREAFEKLMLKRKQANEYFYSGEGVLFLHSAAADIFAHMGLF